MLGLSPVTLISLERRGKLHPLTRPRTHGMGPKLEVVYDPRELAKVPRRERVPVTRDPGELAARAFDYFEQGTSLRDVVRYLRDTPENVEKLYAQWSEMGGADLVLTVAARAALEPHLGAVETITDLVERVAERCAALAIARDAL